MDIIEIDGKEYYELVTTEYNENKYSYLVNTKNKRDICIRKISIDAGEEYFETLDSEEEFDEVLKLLIKKVNKNKDHF